MVNEFRTRQEVVFDILRQRIVSGYYKPGKRLIASDVAEEFSVSRMPVREALSRLSSTGLVELVPYKGAIVNRLTAEDFIEIFNIRAVLEGLAARLACNNLTDADLRKMREANEKIKAMSEGDDTDFQKVNRKFHSIVWKRANSNRLKTLLSNLYSEASQYRHMMIIQPGRMKEVSKEHDLFLDALEKCDTDLAEQRVREHYLSTLDWLMNYFKKLKE